MNKSTVRWRAWFSFLLLILAVPTFAETQPLFRSESALFPAFSLMGDVRPSQSIGAEAGAALLTSKLSPSFLGDALTAGPRLHIRGEQWETRGVLELLGGAETTLWFVNAIGVGGAVDLRIPVAATQGELPGMHVRFGGTVQFRFRRFGEFGAWALRSSANWDTSNQWSVGLGITLQTDGVPGILL